MAHILDADKPLSQSLLWEIQRRYFLRAGIDAWRDDVVPHGISCSPYMARAYADLIVGYLRDLLAAASANDGDAADSWLDLNAPIYIVELGAGSGRLTHHLIHQLDALSDYPPYQDLDLKFILTDFVPETVAFWRAQPQLQALADEGWLDFALFDVMDPQPLQLLHSGVTLAPEQCTNPLILLANYFFDSIPQDSFVLDNGLLSQNLLTLYSSQDKPSLDDPALWDQLSLAYEALPIPYDYAQDVYNEILEIYAQHLPDTTLTFPNVGLDCLTWWRQFGRGNVLLLSADRGHTLIESLVDQPDPLPNLHGSFSMMVNYHAIGMYAELSGGMALQVPHYQDNLQVGAYLFGDWPPTLVETALAFDRSIIKSGPDDFFALERLVGNSAETLTLPQLLSTLRLSAHDADLFRQLQPRLLALMPETTAAWHGDIRSTLASVAAQHLPLGPADRLDELIGEVLAHFDGD